MDYTWWVWYDQETYHLFLALLSKRLDYKVGISNNQTPRDLKAFFFDKQQEGKISMRKKRQILSSRRSGELSWTQRVAGQGAEFGWFLALGKSLDPLLPLCHCHTHERRHLGWTQSLHEVHTSLLKNQEKKVGKSQKSRKFQRDISEIISARNKDGVLENRMTSIFPCILALINSTPQKKPLHLSWFSSFKFLLSIDLWWRPKRFASGHFYSIFQQWYLLWSSFKRLLEIFTFWIRQSLPDVPF